MMRRMQKLEDGLRMEIRIHKSDSNRMLDLLMTVQHSFPENTQDVLQLIRSAQEGITVEIKPLVAEQTDKQRKYYWKWVREFAAWCGMPPDKLHDEILSECYGSDTVNTPFGWMRVPHKRSSTAGRIEYSELIETLIRVAAGFEFVIPPPVRHREMNNTTDKS